MAASATGIVIIGNNATSDVFTNVIVMGNNASAKQNDEFRISDDILDISGDGLHHPLAPTTLKLNAIKSGTSAVGVSPITNVTTAFTLTDCTWMQVVRAVTVSGTVSVTPTAAGLTRFQMTIPISTSSGFSIAGTCTVGNPATPVYYPVNIENLAGTALFTFVSTVAGVALSGSFHYTYLAE